MLPLQRLLPLWLLATASSPAATPPPPLQPGAPVDYSRLAFQPESWKQRGLSLELVPWAGRDVVFLTTDAKLDRTLMGAWVSGLDRGWQLYADLTGRTPRPFKQIDGRTTIAAVPSGELTCGVGCGYIGAGGIELAKFYQEDYPQLKAHPQAMPHYAFYEMGRNFYTFGDRHSCFVTGFAVFMRYVCMDALKCEDLDAPTRRVIEGVEPRLASSGMDFVDLFTTSGRVGEKVNRIKDDKGRLIGPSDQPVCYAAAMLRLRRECGGDDWVRRFFRALAACPPSPPNTREGALGQCWNWFLSASVAARKDLSPVFADQWQLPLAKETRAALGKVDWQQNDLDPAKIAATLTPAWTGQDPPPATTPGNSR